MALEVDPTGTVFLPMGSLDHEGYSMEDPQDFYQHMILEVVSNKINHSTAHEKDLRPVDNLQPRLRARTFNPSGKNAINQQMRINVMYSKAKHARGKVSRVAGLHVSDSGDAYWEAHLNAEKDEVRPKFVAVPLPRKDEAPYLWIDAAWPIRSILLPVSQNSQDGKYPNCAYVQLNFRRLKGIVATIGFYEDKNQDFSDWEGDAKLGMYWTASTASMRVDLDMMYGLLLIPRERREIVDELRCIQMHKWDNVPFDLESADLENLKYEVDWDERSINDVGLRFDEFLRRLHTGGLQSLTQLASNLDDVERFGRVVVPVAGPLLAFMVSEAITAIEDPTGYFTEAKLKEILGERSAKLLLESLTKFGKYLNKKQSPRVGYLDDLAKFQQNPEAFTSDTPADLPVMKKDEKN